MEDLIEAVPGARQVADWFGHWPSFHDAEVLSAELNLTSSSKVCVHTFRMTEELDSRGFYKTDKHCVVTFFVEQITEVKLTEFSYKSVLSDLTLNSEGGEYVLSFNPSYGLEGSIKAKTIRVELVPGMPHDSRYKNLG